MLDSTCPRSTPGRWFRGASVGPPGFDHPADAHESSIKQCARELGWQPPSALQQRDAELADLRDQLAVLRAERDDLRAKFDAIDLLGSEGYRARKKPGRPVKEVVAQ